MFTDLRVYVIVGMFLVAGIALMIFNFIIIKHSKGKRASSAGMVNMWTDLLYKQTGIIPGKEQSESRHRAFLLKQLGDAENLVFFSQALLYLKSEFPDVYSNYIGRFGSVFQQLSVIYKKKPGIERACFADFICEFPGVTGETYGALIDNLISYIDDPNVYCRINVLRALCTIGNAQAIVNTLQVVNDKQLFIHRQTLTTVLSTFRGDKEILGDILWSRCLSWDENLMVSVIQFITSFSEYYKDIFMPYLRDPLAKRDVRIAIVRYYGRHMYEPAHPILLGFVDNPTDTTLAIVAATALESYPKLDTVSTLRGALLSRHWYVRYNASSSLIKLGANNDLLKIVRYGDYHESEIVMYMLEQEVKRQGINSRYYYNNRLDRERISA